MLPKKGVEETSGDEDGSSAEIPLSPCPVKDTASQGGGITAIKTASGTARHRRGKYFFQYAIAMRPLMYIIEAFPYRIAGRAFLKP